MAHVTNFNDKIKIDMFPEEWIALGREIQHHPALIELLQKHPQSEFEVLLAEICTYCEVLLDGIYGRQDISNICNACTARLIKKRGAIMLLSGNGTAQ